MTKINPMVRVAQEWNREVSEELFDIVDSVVWPTLVMTYNDDLNCISLGATFDDILPADPSSEQVDEVSVLIDIFADKSVAVYYKDSSFTTTIQNIPAVMKTFKLLFGVEVEESI